MRAGRRTSTIAPSPASTRNGASPARNAKRVVATPIESTLTASRSSGQAGCGEQLEGFRRLRCADDAHERGKYAHRRAARFLEFVAFAEQAVVARICRIAGVEDRDLAVEADRRAGHKRLFRGNTGAVDGVARRKVVGAVGHDVSSRRQRRELSETHAISELDHAYLRVDRCDARGRCFDFRPADGIGVEENLPLEIGEIDAIGVDQRQRTDTGCREELRDGVAQPPDADDERMRLAKPLLRVDTELGEQDVPAVAQELGVVHGRRLLQALRAQAEKPKTKTPGHAGRSRVGLSGASYCGFACAATALLEAITGWPFN